MKLVKINPSGLSARQREAYNFQKASAILADYGYQTIRLTDDWCGADFIAQHYDGSFLKVQLKSRLAVGRKYEGKDLWIMFPSKMKWYLLPHDDLLDVLIRKKKSIQGTKSWESGGYSIGGLSKELLPMLEKYIIG